MSIKLVNIDPYCPDYINKKIELIEYDLFYIRMDVIEHLETLIALYETKTMIRAATRLRVSQPTVSKRISALQFELGFKLIENVGRNVQLTPDAIRIIEQSTGLLAELRTLLKLPSNLTGPRRLTLGVSESILSSWGPRALVNLRQRFPNFKLELHTHRSPVVIDRVRSGELLVGLCAGIGPATDDVRSELLFEEPMVLALSGRHKGTFHEFRPGSKIQELVTIEAASATWTSIAPKLKKIEASKGIEFQIGTRVESFSAVAELARAGFGHGILPVGIANTHKLKWISFPNPGLSRPISLMARSSTFSQQWIKDMTTHLQENK